MSDQVDDNDAGAAGADDNQTDGRRTADQPIPNTQAPRAGERPDAGHVIPAEKSEPSGVPVNEQKHNADPNAPQTRVVPPGQTQNPPGSNQGVPASSMRQDPEDGTEDARRAAQIPNIPAPPDAGEGNIRQTNEPNESRPNTDA